MCSVGLECEGVFSRLIYEYVSFPIGMCVSPFSPDVVEHCSSQFVLWGVCLPWVYVHSSICATDLV